MSQIETTDNNLGNYIVSDEIHRNNLNIIGNKSLFELEKENPNLLVFPTSFDRTADKIGTEKLFSIDSANCLTTSNIMGFIGMNNSQLTIKSRFHNHEKDFFLHYMLQKVFSINLIDLKFDSDSDNIWDILLIYLFPFYLKKALNQGLYKEYVNIKNNNNANVKGAIDISRHLKENLLFKGSISYNTREYSYDNKMTQLVRHTIEFIKSKKHIQALRNNKETKEHVSLIIQNTTSYNKSNRKSVVNDNKKTIHHPFYTEYKTLQKICLKILRKEGISFGKDENNKAYGIVFDGAWLWEEYLNTIIKDLHFIHPENKKRKNGIPLFRDNNNSIRFPDFYSVDKQIVLDAKYKRFENWNPNGENNIDVYQIITYLHCLESKHAGLLFPISEQFNCTSNKIENIGILCGYGGKLHKIGLNIPNNIYTFPEFIDKMKSNELVLLNIIKNLN